MMAYNLGVWKMICFNETLNKNQVFGGSDGGRRLDSYISKTLGVCRIIELSAFSVWKRCTLPRKEVQV